ncbi:Hypothetical protein FKW44_023811, partial [Caligus rogercresseyi]
IRAPWDPSRPASAPPSPSGTRTRGFGGTSVVPEDDEDGITGEYESWRGKKFSSPSAKPSIASGMSFFASAKSSF